MFLTREEVTELTGRLQRNAQIRALRHMGIEHKIRPDGSPAVLRSHIEKEFDGNDSPANIHQRVEPNWAAL